MAICFRFHANGCRDWHNPGVITELFPFISEMAVSPGPSASVSMPTVAVTDRVVPLYFRDGSVSRAVCFRFHANGCRDWQGCSPLFQRWQCLQGRLLPFPCQRLPWLTGLFPFISEMAVSPGPSASVSMPTVAVTDRVVPLYFRDGSVSRAVCFRFHANGCRDWQDPGGCSSRSTGGREGTDPGRGDLSPG